MRNQPVTYATYQPLTNGTYSTGRPAEAAVWHPITFLLAEVVSLLAAGAVGAFIFFVWVIGATGCPCSAHDDLCFFGEPATSGAGFHLVGSVATVAYASLGVLILAGFVVFWFRARVRRPFLLLVVGFPVYYLVLLVLISVAARVVWGPTRC
jgi:hypothetical protein